MIGPAIGSIVSITVYNVLRTAFLWKKFRLFPLTIQSLYTVLLAAAVYAVCYFSFQSMHGLLAIILRSLVFIVLFGSGVLYLKLTPDIAPVWQTIRNKWRIN